MRVLFSVIISLMFLGAAVAKPVQICVVNNSESPIHFGFGFPNGSQSHRTLNPGESHRQAGDTEGVLCISKSYFGDPNECPENEVATEQHSQKDFLCDE